MSIPTAIHVSAALLLREQLLPALMHLAAGDPRQGGASSRASSRPGART